MIRAVRPGRGSCRHPPPTTSPSPRAASTTSSSAPVPLYPGEHRHLHHDQRLHQDGDLARCGDLQGVPVRQCVRGRGGGSVPRYRCHRTPPSDDGVRPGPARGICMEKRRRCWQPWPLRRGTPQRLNRQSRPAPRRPRLRPRFRLTPRRRPLDAMASSLATRPPPRPAGPKLRDSSSSRSRGEIRGDYWAQGLIGRGAYRAFGCPELRRRRRKDDGGSGPSRGWCGDHGSSRLPGTPWGWYRRLVDWVRGGGRARTTSSPSFPVVPVPPGRLGLGCARRRRLSSERDPAPVAVGQFLQRIQQDVWKVPYPLGRGVLGHLTSNRGGTIRANSV